MNKATITKMAKAKVTSSQAVQKPADPDVAEIPGVADLADFAGMTEQSIRAMLYVGLVSNTDFLRTQAGEGALCELAYERAEVAVKTWTRRERKAGRA